MALFVGYAAAMATPASCGSRQAMTQPPDPNDQQPNMGGPPSEAGQPSMAPPPQAGQPSMAPPPQAGEPNMGGPPPQAGYYPPAPPVPVSAYGQPDMRAIPGMYFDQASGLQLPN